MNINDYSSLALAFIGDAHYGLVVKRYVIDKEVVSNKMQVVSSKFCSAKFQAEVADYLLTNNIYTEKEIEIYKRGRNTKTHAAPKNTSIQTYHMSTGFEAVWGYWYLENDLQRIEQIWEIIKTLGEK